MLDNLKAVGHYLAMAIRKTIRIVSLIITAIVIAPVVGEFFVSLATEQGLYENPSQRVETVVTWFLSLGDNPYFLVVMVLVLGFTIGVWLDFFFRKKQPKPAPSSSNVLSTLEQIHAYGVILLNKDFSPLTWMTNARKWDEKATETINKICSPDHARRFRMEILNYNLDISPDTVRLGLDTETTRRALQKKLEVLKDIIRSHDKKFDTERR